MAVKGHPFFYSYTSKYKKVCCRGKAAGRSRPRECGLKEMREQNEV